MLQQRLRRNGCAIWYVCKKRLPKWPSNGWQKRLQEQKPSMICILHHIAMQVAGASVVLDDFTVSSQFPPGFFTNPRGWRWTDCCRSVEVHGSLQHLWQASATSQKETLEKVVTFWCSENRCISLMFVTFCMCFFDLYRLIWFFGIL